MSHDSNNSDLKWERLPTHAFGYKFTHLPEHVREEMSALEREGVLYEDHWIDELDDYRHVRIQFTEDEAREYARRVWAYELFLRAGRPKAARDVKGIDEDVARDADGYSLNLRDGTTVPAPYHCFAAFLGSHLESLTCGGLPERRTVLELQGRDAALLTLKRSVQALTPTIRSFEKREAGLSPWPVRQEDDVRDLLYVMLRPALFDLVKEEPTPSLAGTHKFIDLCSKTARILIELKWIGKKGSWKRILEQIHIDIQCYPAHPSCETLIFVVVDTVRDVPDPRLVERDLSGSQQLHGKDVDVRVWVVEP